jgi:polysaccharide pyruvyl transferase WcaK-like protein
MPDGLFREVGKTLLAKCIYPPVTNWIRGFMDAEFVNTDSFHGTVFSINFNKPFISIGNKKRGMTRFDSLLKMFGLENRLIDSTDKNVLEIIHEKIDFIRVNKILDNKRKEAKLYMKNALQDA